MDPEQRAIYDKIASDVRAALALSIKDYRRTVPNLQAMALGIAALEDAAAELAEKVRGGGSAA